MRRVLCICLAILLFLGVVTPAALAESVPAFRTEPMVAVGSFYTVALRNDGTVWAWGANGAGQLGDGTTTNRRTPVQVQGLANVTAVSVSLSNIVALRSDGTVWAWGDNFHGQLGDGASGDGNYSAIPIQVPTLTNVIAVSAGGRHSVALRNDGTVWTWGNNEFGQLGDGTGGEWDDYSFIPVQVQTLTNVTEISAGSGHTVVLRDDGTIWAWGNNWNGQLGDGTRTNRHTPVQVQNLTNVTAVSAGLQYSVALRSDGTVWTWGNNAYGQLGNGAGGELGDYSAIPAQVLTNAMAVSAGSTHTMALRSDDTVWAWGWNGRGELGDGTTTHRYTPVQVQNLTNVIAISAGLGHTVALRSDGAVWAWGLNHIGQLGDGAGGDGNYSATPVQVLGPDGVRFLNLILGRTPFTDVPLHAWFHDAVEFVYDRGIMSGTSPTTFAPNANFSREMVVATLFRMYHGRPANSTDARDTPFADVDAGRWYAPYIAWGYSQGIVTGTSPTTFGTGNAVSRQDFAVLLHRFADFVDVDTDVPGDFALDFPDASAVGSWARDALTWAVHEGLITGTGQLLAPTGTAIRAQAATILMRYVQAFVE